ncbi:hypothetical protein U9M48_033905 [Paspalum notatum var. saurae]|uniref:Uncharacterized protein n=1 Tax=Paspalum notatum var. saurae TaxID=547442 RepID=A0AAQ3UBE5_PASNO
MGNASTSLADDGGTSALPLPETSSSSSCLTHAVTTAHNFDVINFSLLEGMGIGNFVCSRNFSVGGYNWNITLYPDGYQTADNAQFVSVYLAAGGGQAGVRAKFSLSVPGKDGKVWIQRSTEQHNPQQVIFGSTGGGGFDRWGWNRFIAKSRLGPLLRDNHDRFTIRCVLTVIKDPVVEDVVAIAVPAPSVLQDLAGMLKSGVGADVTFVVGGQRVPAHRCVLAARSAVFKAELLGAMREKGTAHVRIDDMEPSVFEALLHFVYTGTLPDGCDVVAGKNNVLMMQHLLVAADRYGLHRLRLMCEEKMCRSVDAETVATTLALADQHQCAQLKNACLSFLVSSGVLGTVRDTNGFHHLAASCPMASSPPDSPHSPRSVIVADYLARRAPSSFRPTSLPHHALSLSPLCGSAAVPARSPRSRLSPAVPAESPLLSTLRRRPTLIPLAYRDSQSSPPDLPLLSREGRGGRCLAQANNEMLCDMLSALELCYSMGYHPSTSSQQARGGVGAWLALDSPDMNGLQSW